MYVVVVILGCLFSATAVTVAAVLAYRNTKG